MRSSLARYQWVGREEVGGVFEAFVSGSLYSEFLPPLLVVLTKRVAFFSECSEVDSGLAMLRVPV